MKKITLILLMMALIMVAGCEDNNQKNIYLPEAKNDKSYTTIGGGDETHNGEGYTLAVPAKGYHYEKDYDDGILEEKWDYTKKDDVELKVTTFKNSDEIAARGRFMGDNEDYIFEDVTEYPLCGQELDGDTLWFNIHESNGTVYIVSWEYPRNTKDDLKEELANIASTFKLAE